MVRIGFPTPEKGTVLVPKATKRLALMLREKGFTGEPVKNRK